MLQLLLVFSLLAGACLAQTAIMDQGGVSIDLSRCEIPAPDAAGPDFVNNGDFKDPEVDFKRFMRWNWCGGQNFQGVTPEKRRELLAASDGMFQRSKVTVDGRICARLVTSPDILQFLDEQGRPTITNSIYQDVRVPSGGTYTLRFKVRGNLSKGAGFNSMVVLVSCLSEDGNRRLVEDLNQRIAVSGSFQDCVLTVNAPTGTGIIRPGFFIYGIGEIELAGIQLQAVRPTREIGVELYPLGFMDRLFAVACGQPAALYFAVQNPDDLPLKNPELILELPGGFELIAPSRLLQAFPAGENTWRIPIPVTNLGREFTTRSVVPPLLITSNLPAGEQRYPARFHTRNGDAEGTVRSFSLQVIPEIKARQRPKIFLIGLIPTYMNQYKGTGADLVAGFYKDCGFNAVQNNFQPEMSEAYQQAGLLRAVWQGPSNGYDMGRPGKPGGVVFRRADGSIEPAMYAAGCGEAICPVEVYRRGDYYREMVLSPLQAGIAANQFDLLINNWEPQQCLRGCFCERCRGEFIRYSRLPEAEVLASWPQSIRDKWGALWLKFRAWQMGRMIATLEQDVAAEGLKHKRDLHFLPAITSQAMREATTASYPTYNPEEYIHDLPWICPWGPYVFRDMKSPYVYNNAAWLQPFLCARDVQAYLGKRIADPEKFPRLIAYPHGNQCFSWCTAPEMPAFEMYCYFLHRWKGALAYIFPYGYDHRFFATLAAASEDIAVAEEIVFNGQPVDRVQAIPVTPLPESYYKGGRHSHYPDIQDQGLLQVVAYQREGTILAAVGNFWPEGECFFLLKVSGLPEKEAFAVCLPSQKALFAVDETTFFSGGDLARGVLLQTGAFRWNLYQIIPQKTGMDFAGSIISRSRVQESMQQRLPGIQSALAFEAEEAARLKMQRSADEVPDYSGLQNLKGDGIEAQYTDGIYSFLSAEQKITVDLKRGGKIASWVYRGIPLIAEHPDFGLGIEGAWEPRAFTLNSPVRVLALVKEEKALVLEMERRISHSESKFMEGVTIRKKIRISEGELKQASTVINTTGDSQSLAFRWHNMILFPEFEFSTLQGPLKLKRDFNIRVFKCAGEPGDFLVQGKRKPATLISAAEAIFRHPDNKLNLRVVVAPGDMFDSFVMWDGPLPAPTFEPVFQQRTLNAGISETYELTLKVEAQP